MPTYIFKAKQGPANVIEDTIIAESKQDAISRLSKQGLFPISIKETSDKYQGKTHVKGRISQSDIALFTRQLVDLLEGGLTLHGALNTLTQQTENKNLANVIDGLRNQIKEGNPLSSAMSKYPKTFKPYYISMVKAGETGGIIEETLSRLAELIEQEQELKSKVMSAMVYPILLSLFGILTVSVLMIFVIPKLASVFSEFGQQLPLPTAILINVSNFLSKWWWIGAIVLFFIVILIYKERKSKEGKYYIDGILLKTPLLGKLIQKTQLARLSRTLSSLINSGVPVVNAMEIVCETVENEVIKRKLVSVKENVSKGIQMGDSFAEQDFTPLLVNMINVGEKGGFLENTLIKVSNSYESEIERYTKHFTTLLEPILLLFMGLVVGFIVFSMLLPIFNLNLAMR